MRLALASAAAAIAATGADACTYTCERDGEKDDSKCTSPDGSGFGYDCCASEGWSEPQTCEWGWEPTCHDDAGPDEECWRHGGDEGGCHEECNDHKCNDYIFQDCIYNDNWMVGEHPGCYDDYEPRHLAGSNPSKTYRCCRDTCEGEGGGGGIIVVIFIVVVVVAGGAIAGVIAAQQRSRGAAAPQAQQVIVGGQQQQYVQQPQVIQQQPQVMQQPQMVMQQPQQPVRTTACGRPFSPGCVFAISHRRRCVQVVMAQQPQMMMQQQPMVQAQAMPSAPGMVIGQGP